MNLERWILIAIIVITILTIFTCIPRNKARDACVLFLFLQVLTWPAGLFPVEMGWIEYPIQLLPDANHTNRTSLIFEFFIFPIVAILFSLYFPNVKRFGALMYYVGFAGFFTIIESILERTTSLVDYHGWSWYWTLLTVMICLFFNNKFYRWYKKKLIKVPANE
ncbi:hypothetical protein FZW96_14525 [Bacillus sp. BGMRC 2118]|nr:hypothetical protein FZW96_14525 [Bacillus sp. BGMRC 2118]